MPGTAAARPLVLLALVATACGGTSAEHPLVVLLGDSTTAGWSTDNQYVLSPDSPLGTLAALAPADSRWRRMEAVSLGVPGSTTGDWATAIQHCDEAPSLQAGAPRWVVMVVRACQHGEPLVAEVPGLFDRPIAAALVTLGTNDARRDPAARPEDAVERLRAIAAALAPARVLLASPFWTTDERRAPFVEGIATLLAQRGLLTGPDFAHLRLPLDRGGVHLTRGGFLAAAALWLDALAGDAR